MYPDLYYSQRIDPFVLKLNVFLFQNEESWSFHQTLNDYVKPRVSFPTDPTLIGQHWCVSLNSSERLYTLHFFSRSVFESILQEINVGHW